MYTFVIAEYRVTDQIKHNLSARVCLTNQKGALCL